MEGSGLREKNWPIKMGLAKEREDREKGGRTGGREGGMGGGRGRGANPFDREGGAPL